MEIICVAPKGSDIEGITICKGQHIRIDTGSVMVVDGAVSGAYGLRCHYLENVQRRPTIYVVPWSIIRGVI